MTPERCDQARRTLEQVRALIEAHAVPTQNAEILKQLRLLLGRLRIGDAYIGEKCTALESLARDFYSVGKHEKYRFGSDGVYRDMRGLLALIESRIANYARSGLRYAPRMAAKDAPMIAAMKKLSAQYPRYGYRRIAVFLRRDGLGASWQRIYRLWRQCGLQLPRRRPRRRVAQSRPRPTPAMHANAVWAYDFVFDACANGQQLKCLTIIDEYTQECLAIDVAGSIRAARVIEVLSRLISVRGAPHYLRSDNGPEFVSTALLNWALDEGIHTALIELGKPWQNGANESFNGKFRDECLNIEWFRSRDEARVIIETWRKHHNAVRPHSSLGYLTPNEFSRQLPSLPNRAAFQE